MDIAKALAAGINYGSALQLYILQLFKEQPRLTTKSIVAQLSAPNSTKREQKNLYDRALRALQQLEQQGLIIKQINYSNKIPFYTYELA